MSTSPETTFAFLDPGPLRDDSLELHLRRRQPAVPAKSYVPAYVFQMRHPETKQVMGGISLRVGNTEPIFYGGHIGYRVEPSFRGQRFAARSCRLLLPLARRHGLNPVWITCNPENIASRRTCEILGARLVETVDVPEYSEIYLRGELRKCRYRIDLREP